MQMRHGLRLRLPRLAVHRLGMSHFAVLNRPNGSIPRRLRRRHGTVLYRFRALYG